MVRTRLARAKIKLLNLLLQVQGSKLRGKSLSNAVQQPLELSITCSLGGLTGLGVPGLIAHAASPIACACRPECRLAASTLLKTQHCFNKLIRIKVIAISIQVEPEECASMIARLAVSHCAKEVMLSARTVTQPSRSEDSHMHQHSRKGRKSQATVGVRSECLEYLTMG